MTKDNNIPNYDRYKQIIDWWIKDGYQGLKGDEEIIGVINRLIRKCGKTYKKLYSIIPNDLFADNNTKISLRIFPCSRTNRDIVAADDSTLITIYDAIGIDPRIFGYNTGHIFKNEILICGKYTIDNNAKTLKFASKNANFSDLIERLTNLQNTMDNNNIQDEIVNNVRDLSVNIDNLKKSILELNNRGNNE